MDIQNDLRKDIITLRDCETGIKHKFKNIDGKMVEIKEVNAGCKKFATYKDTPTISYVEKLLLDDYFKKMVKIIKKENPEWKIDQTYTGTISRCGDKITITMKVYISKIQELIIGKFFCMNDDIIREIFIFNRSEIGNVFNCLQDLKHYRLQYLLSKYDKQNEK